MVNITMAQRKQIKEKLASLGFNKVTYKNGEFSLNMENCYKLQYNEESLNKLKQDFENLHNQIINLIPDFKNAYKHSYSFQIPGSTIKGISLYYWFSDGYIFGV